MQASINNMNHALIESDQLNSFLSRQNSLLESLIQIYKQFLKLDMTSRDGLEQLNKKLCVIESIKFYVEHLILFHKFEMLLPPKTDVRDATRDEPIIPARNNISEMQVNFTIIEKRWVQRRQEQIQLLEVINAPVTENTDVIYPFTYLIDCLFEECRAYANVAHLFTAPGAPQSLDDTENYLGYGYPPKSLMVISRLLIIFSVYHLNLGCFNLFKLLLFGSSLCYFVKNLTNNNIFCFFSIWFSLF